MSEDEQEEVIEINETAENNPNELNASADTLRILEALLFASDELLTPSRLKTILPGTPDGKQIRKMVDKINVQLQKERHPFEIVEIGGGYQFRTVSFYHTWVRQIFKEKASKKLSVQALECLAIIAYKQPLSKAEIEAIRGVVSDGAMKTLLEKRLVVINGRSDKPGRPLLYATSSEFLKYFGLNKIADLPRIEEFEAIAREKMDELSIEELAKDDETTEPESLNEEMLENANLTSIQEHNDLSEEMVPSDKESIQSEADVQKIDQIPAPENTAVFEINFDKDELKSDDSSDNSEGVLEPVSKESAKKTTDETKDEDEQNESISDDADVFDLEIAFDEEIEDVVSEQNLIEEKATGKDESDTVIFEKKDEKKAADSTNEDVAIEDEELLEIFLPDDNDGESRGGEENKGKH